eukprot:scaffold261329_cov65-Attheya_sp.AAC.1
MEVVVVEVVVVDHGIGGKLLRNLLRDGAVVDEVEVVVDEGVGVITMMVLRCMMARLRPWRGGTIVGNRKRIRLP